MSLIPLFNFLNFFSYFLLFLPSIFIFYFFSYFKLIEFLNNKNCTLLFEGQRKKMSYENNFWTINSNAIVDIFDFDFIHSLFTKFLQLRFAINKTKIILKFNRISWLLRKISYSSVAQSEPKTTRHVRPWASPAS